MNYPNNNFTHITNLIFWLHVPKAKHPRKDLAIPCAMSRLVPVAIAASLSPLLYSSVRTAAAVLFLHLTVHVIVSTAKIYFIT